MDKVKVNKKLFNALEEILKFSTKEQLLKRFASSDFWVSEIFSPFNEIKIFDLAEILVRGYEVECAPEEELLKIYKSHEIVICGSEPHFNKGIKTALHILGIKIKGIND